MRISGLAATLLAIFLASCNRATETVSAESPQPGATGAVSVAYSSDPSSGNLAPLSQTPVSYDSPPPAPDAYYDSPGDDSSYEAVEATQPPPPLPEYDQPPIPEDGDIWTPGYWAWTDGGYYWVPGAWVMAPWVDALWTPPYWEYVGSRYRWHAGYWGPHVGFYGGINYGFGYTGHGYYGAYWRDGRVNYNRNVTNVNVTVVHNHVYNYAVPAATNRDRASFNGGRGTSARPTPQELAVARDPRTRPVAAQIQAARQAASNRGQFAGRSHQPATVVDTRSLPTSYRAPAQQAPAAAVQAAARVQTQAPAQAAPRPNPFEEQRQKDFGRNRQAQPERGLQQAAPMQRGPEPQRQPQPAPMQRGPEPQRQPQPAPMQRGPEPQRQPQPAPMQRGPEPQRQPQPAPMQRGPEPQRQPQSAPMQRGPEPQRQPQPAPMQRGPEPQRQPQPAPMQRGPEPQRQPQSAPMQRGPEPQRGPQSAPQGRGEERRDRKD